jgi:phosphodiesterase/alkaline phosphatase D-like protein
LKALLLLLWSTAALAAAPTATTNAASSLTTSSASLNGSGDPNGEQATGYFRIDTTDPEDCDATFGVRVPATGGTDLGSGNTDVAYSITATGLVPGTTYWFCALVENASGVAFGEVRNFTVPAPPVVVTSPADSLTTSSAVLRGSANPLGSSTTGWFRYSSSDPGDCSDSFGARIPSSGGTSLGAGSAAVDFSRSITSGLQPGRTYYACAIASNSFGTSFGDVVPFTTPAAPPTVSTQSPTVIEGDGATLRASVNPGGADTTVWFRVGTISPGTCNDSYGTRAPGMGGTALTAGNSSQSVTREVSGLTPDTTYYVCAIAENAAGKSFGSVVTIVTPLPPTVETRAASAITNSSATLNGVGNPNRASATGWFRYSATDPEDCDDSFGSRAPVTGADSLGSGTSDRTFSESITGLTQGATYYFCAIVQSNEGLVFGEVLSFTTAEPPTARTDAASGITSATAVLNGAGIANGNSTTGWFRYSSTEPDACTDNFGSREPSFGGSSLGSDRTERTYGRSISGLQPGRTYYYCAITSNSYGSAFGAVREFTTPPTEPTANTSSATSITSATATLRGLSNPSGADTTVWFRYSTTSPGTCNDSFGTRTPTMDGQDIGSGNSTVSFTRDITGLTEDTTYYYCAIAENSEGKVWGSVVTFVTALAPTVQTNPATSITNTSATLQGEGVPNRASSTGWFRYSATAPQACNDTFGSRAPTSTGGTSLGSGTSRRTFSQSITGLTQGATYYFCAIVESGEGLVFGEVLSFRTVSPPQAATDEVVTNITATSATLAGSGLPNGASTTGWFRYSSSDPGVCSDSFGARAPTSGGSSLGASFDVTDYTRGISSLVPGQTYYFCAITSNSYGTAFGEVESFTTGTEAPTVSTSSATSIGGETATLRGSSDAGGAATTGWFRYSTISPGTCNDSFGTRAPETGGVAVGSGTNNATFTQDIAELTPGTTYYVCAFAQNTNGMAMGSVVTFTTPLAPEVTTTVVSSLASTSVTLNGRANPNRSSTTGWFRYSATDPEDCDDAFGSRAPVTGGSSLGSGTSDRTFSQSISGLSAGTTYYYCAIAQSVEGAQFGEVLSFTTVDAPLVRTDAATNIGTTTATLNGAADPNGASTTGWFRYSTTDPGECSDSFGTRAPTSSGTGVGAGDGFTTFSRGISNLQSGETYYACAIASNAYGTVFGDVVTFTTSGDLPTVSTSSAINLSSTTATLRGSADPNGGATVGWFRYATTNPIECNDQFGTRLPTMGGENLGDGRSSVSYEEDVTGLTAGTTYYFCAVAQNAEGQGYGTVRSFTTPLPPTVQTNDATSISSSTATLNAESIPNGAATTAWFRFSAIEPEACDDAFGARAPSSGGDALGSGSSTRSFSEPISGLSAGVTYYYCAIAMSSEGTSFGEVASFTTLDAPAVTTQAVTNIQATSATFSALVNPNGASGQVWFRFSETDPGTCSDSFGSRSPSSGGSSFSATRTDTTLTRSTSGLVPGATYYVCAIANNAYGTSFGDVVTFSTPADAPSVNTLSPTLITGAGATLRGQVDPGGSPTGGWFRYSTVSPGTCNDSFGIRAPTMGAEPLGDGSSNVTYEQDITGLSPGTTYYICAIAQNAVSKEWGDVVTITTPLPPLAETAPVTGLTNSSATLQGRGNPNRATATGWFRYSATDPVTCNDTFGSRAPETGGTSLGSGTTLQSYNRSISNLSSGTTYYYCAIVSTSEGLDYGEVFTFTTLDAPIVTTSAATQVTASSATLNGFADPNGSSTTGWFRYSTTDPEFCTDGFGLRAPTSGGSNVGSGAGEAPFSRSISNLLPGTTYYFCAIASSSYGESYGEILSFTTPATAPTISTFSATSVTSTSATLRGSADPNGAATNGWFRIHTTSPGTCNNTFGQRAPVSGGIDVGEGTSSVTYTIDLTGLTPGTTYYYCAIGQNGIGQDFGNVVQFTTRRPPAVSTLAATPVTATTATLNGEGTPNGSAATGWFRYDVVDPGTCNDTFGTRAPSSGGTNLGSGNSPVAYAQAITGLSPGTTYYVCAIAESSIGKTFGDILSFTTPTTAPGVTTLSPTGLSFNSATLQASVTPNGDEAIGWFRLSTTNPVTCDDTFGQRAPAMDGVMLGAGGVPVPLSLFVGGLSPDTTYYVCALAENSAGLGAGQVITFTTPAGCSAGDNDGDGVCDDVDLCVGDDQLGDEDFDGVCDDLDVCLGDDATGDSDADGVCDDSDFRLSGDGFSPGQTLTLTVEDAPANRDVFFMLSTRPPPGGGGPCGPGAPTVCLDIGAPTILGRVAADATGTAVFTVTVPPTLSPGARAYFQAAWLDAPNGDVTNFIQLTAQ